MRQQEEYVPQKMEITREELQHIADPIGRLLVEDYIRKGHWTVIQ